MSFGAPILANPITGAVLSGVGGLIPSGGILFNGLQVLWGVFDASGNLAIQPDTFYGVEPATPYMISDYPIEQGTFGTYNKVKVPERVAVRMVTGGTEANRTAFIAVLDRMVADTNVYTIVNPDKTWKNMNLMSYDFRRDARNGANMLMVNCLFQEIRSIQSVSYSSLTPSASQTNPTTSTGMPDPTQTAQPQAQMSQSQGGVSSGAVLPAWGIAAGSEW